MSNTLTDYDKILKELQIIETIFHSQMNPDFHLGSGMGFPRYCNEIFIISDVELLKISDYKREYTSRLEQSNNTSLVINELKTIYNKSVELYNYFVSNLHNHSDKKEFFVGKDGGQQIIDSTGYYYFMNYTVRFGFFEVEQDSEFMNNIHSTFFKNSFRYNCKNETLVDFCVQLIKFIDLSGVLVENQITSTNPDIKQNPFPNIFVGNNSKAFDIFNDFAKEVTDSYLDFSFIFQKMKKKEENLIENRCRHIEFMDWLFENKYISNAVYDNFKEKNSFSSKAERGMRVTRYYSIKEKYFPVNSD